MNEINSEQVLVDEGDHHQQEEQVNENVQHHQQEEEEVNNTQFDETITSNNEDSLLLNIVHNVNNNNNLNNHEDHVNNNITSLPDESNSNNENNDNIISNNSNGDEQLVVTSSTTIEDEGTTEEKPKVMMMIDSTILHEDDNELLTRNYLIELLSQASIAIKLDLLDNQYQQAKKMYIQVSTKLDQLSPFVPQQYSKILNKYSKLYFDRANHMSKLNQQEQFNNTKNVNNSTAPAAIVNNTNVSEGVTTEENFIVIENNLTVPNNSNNASSTSLASVNSNNNINSNQSNNQSASSNQISSSHSTLSNILSNHKKIKKSVKELNAELHDYLYPSEVVSNIGNQQHSIIFNDKFQFMEEEIPNYSNEFDVPTKYRHRTYWLIKRLSQTMLNGGYLFPNLYISKKVWFQQGAKLFGQSHKINFCQKLTEVISDFKTDMLIHSKNGKDIKLIDFGSVINIQDKLLNNMLILQKDLSKYINLNIQLQQSNQPLSIQDPNMFNNLFSDDDNEDSENNTSNPTMATNENENYNIDSSISLSSKVFGFGKSMFKTISNTIKGNAKEETSERPYVPWLIQVFNNIHFIDDWITIYEDLLKEFSTTSKIREIEELKLILERFERISLILHTTLCNFVLQDLQILLERFILKSRDSLSKLFVQKNVPIL